MLILSLIIDFLLQGFIRTIFREPFSPLENANQTLTNKQNSLCYSSYYLQHHWEIFMRALVLLSLFLAPFFQSFAAECKITLKEDFNTKNFSETKTIQTEVGNKNYVEFPNSLSKTVSFKFLNIGTSPDTGSEFCIEHHVPFATECRGDYHLVGKQYWIKSEVTHLEGIQVSVDCGNI